MKTTAIFFLLLLISASTGLHAQTFSLITGREPVVSLDGLWRFHTGDHPPGPIQTSTIRNGRCALR